jgi:hypothetical protein
VEPKTPVFFCLETLKLCNLETFYFQGFAGFLRKESIRRLSKPRTW